MDAQRHMAAAVRDAEADGRSASSAAERIAKFGARAEWPGNISRDLERYVVREGLVNLQTYRDPTVVKDRKSGSSDTIDWPVLFAHEVVYELLEEDESAFYERFACDASSLATYWHSCRGHEWFQEHPCRDDILREPSRWAPLRVHGDDAPMSKTSSIAVLNPALSNSLV